MSVLFLTKILLESSQSTTLNATGGTSYEWTPKTDLSDGFIANPVASPLVTITYFVNATDSNDCPGMDSVIITVNPAEDTSTSPEFTNLFTPNGDGHNDYWNITTLAQCTQCKVSIYNRYGQEV